MVYFEFLKKNTMERDKELLVSGTALVPERGGGGEYQDKYPRQQS